MSRETENKKKITRPTYKEKCSWFTALVGRKSFKNPAPSKQELCHGFSNRYLHFEISGDTSFMYDNKFTPFHSFKMNITNNPLSNKYTISLDNIR